VSARTGDDQARRTADAVDRLLPCRAVVFGSLPPAASDLDLLVLERDLARAERSLLDAGFRRRSRHLEGGGGPPVELHGTSFWQLSNDAAERLLHDARALPGYGRLVAPAPHHAILIAARRFAAGERRLERLRVRIERAVAEDPDAWSEAGRLAGSWGVDDVLPSLRRALQGEPRSATLVRAHVVSLSGIDGAGKTRQAYALRNILVEAGVPATVEWNRAGRDPSLNLLARPIKRAIGRVRRAPFGGSSDAHEAAGRDVRTRSRLLTYGWATTVAAVNALANRRSAWGRRGVVICDRYVLDTAVHIRDRYVPARRPAVAIWLCRIVSPRPLRAFFLDVNPADALRRKRDAYDAATLERVAMRYREEHVRLGVTRIDGDRAPADVSAEIAAEVLGALHRRRVGIRRDTRHGQP
jgi:thymidylate kinase